MQDICNKIDEYYGSVRELVCTDFIKEMDKS